MSRTTTTPTGAAGAPDVARPVRRPGGAATATTIGGPAPHDWYKDAVIYEVHVRAFQDSDGDGIGDFRGLTSRLDYLQELGITAIWLLPFYPSPLRDDGYDIADYTSVHPDYGTMEDFRAFVAEAHRRDIRVITELVINHTSDQHPWFQRARRSRAGSPHRDFYVWSDTPDRYPGVRIIFQDTETSNWSWDPVAGQYYWHRFFSHQPDLNFDNPAVLEAVMNVMDFWFEAGVDGMRLDAVPYLIERDGTNCENLEETHGILRALRSHLDERWPGRMFLAEANQWPEDAIAYFGDGDECHMNFHFPLMPRLFMSLRMEDCFPIIDILAQTPPIPESCQWAMFLRNHDELTLEMVTDEERDYMYRSYAADGQMRINLGIRRRLAPLLEHDRRKIELLKGLLMSMPGTPVLYYGDEIGMGDNIYLGDRDAVRTPMQWSSDRNAGFSRVNPQRLFLPVNIEPGSHYETVNVESQQANPSSLLWWTRRLISLRKRHPVMARGTTEFLHPDNPKVLAFLRSGGPDEEDILVVANLSRFAQPVELDLSRFEGRTPVELFGSTRFPRIGELPYFLTLGPHNFHWMALDPGRGAARPEEEPPIETSGEPGEWLRSREMPRWATRRLPVLLPHRRWFAGKARTIRSVDVEQVIPLDDLADGVVDAVLALVRVSFTEGDDDLYSLPMALLESERALRQAGVSATTTLGAVGRRDEDAQLVLADATGDESFWRRLDQLIDASGEVRSERGRLFGQRIAGPREDERRAGPGATAGQTAAGDTATGETEAAADTARPARPAGGREASGRRDAGVSEGAVGAEAARPGTAPTPPAEGLASTVPPESAAGAPPEIRLSSAEQSNSSAFLGRSAIMKLFRRVEAGINPDLEIGEHLTCGGRFEHTPRMLGSVSFQSGRAQPLTLGIKQEMIPNEGDAWRHATDAVDRYLERVIALPGEEQPAIPPHRSPLDAARLPADPAILRHLDGYPEAAELLGRRTGEMHRALADADASAPDFVPEPFSKLYLRSLYQSLRNGVRRSLNTVSARVGTLEGEPRALADRLLARSDALIERIGAVRELPLGSLRIRCHGDFHLGQCLWTGRDFFIIDFEGEPMRPLGERRLKRSCLSDVAGMCRSMDYAANAGLRAIAERGIAEELPGDDGTLRRLADFWSHAAQAAFLRGYLQVAGEPLVPREPTDVRILLDAWMVHKAAYEIDYELNNRPDWVTIPLRGILEVLDDAPPGASAGSAGSAGVTGAADADSPHPSASPATSQSTSSPTP